MAGLFTSHTSADAAGTSCLPSAVKAKLAQIRAKFGSISIVSAHRPGARIAGSGKRSYHASCRAVDFHAPRGKHSQVVAWLKANHSGGVGTYSCGMNHIHIDNGPRVRFHHCVNASGTPVGKKRHYAKRSNKKTYARKGSGKRYAKYGSKTRYSKNASSKRYAKKSTSKRYSATAAKKRTQHAANARWSVNKYAAF
ncbi:MAG: hypothetical protein APF80_03770 [Alphaproteobacteria bacterium BRH_c36]|nr:MAG: hypothetical protein APF80_03770 [Alphaproteobacteria bacterium BRH_c36]